MLSPKAMNGEYGTSMNAELKKITKDILNLESQLAEPSSQG